MANLGSFTRSAARGTFSAYRSLPIRWRLAGGSAALTFVILASFAVIVGILTNRQVRSQFDNQLITASQRLTSQVLSKELVIHNQRANCDALPLTTFAEGEHAVIRVFDYYGGSLLCTQASEPPRSRSANVLFSTAPLRNERFNSAGYRVIARIGIPVHPSGYKISILYAQPLSDIDQTLARVQAFLLLGVLGGAVLALLAGLFVSERAMSPIKELTSAAREIGRTEDTRRRIPHPEAEDEIAELARTLEGMLGALDASRTRTQSLLERQREFVADASHELRTPLTSVLANLELLTEELEGEQSETAEAALRSTRRMRRLVGDLLLLARADAKREAPHRPTDLSEVLGDAAGELSPVAESHELTLSPLPALIDANRDELHRLILNLLENALRHTPAGTAIRAGTRTEGAEAILEIEDEGPGIPPQLRTRVFERFVRGHGDSGGGTGLGLAIVRAVAASHDATVVLGPTHAGGDGPDGGRGTRFEIRFPASTSGIDSPAADPGSAPADQTSTTTGRTMGRRLRRS